MHLATRRYSTRPLTRSQTPYGTCEGGPSAEGPDRCHCAPDGVCYSEFSKALMPGLVGALHRDFTCSRVAMPETSDRVSFVYHGARHRQAVETERTVSRAASLSPQQMDAYSRNASMKGGIGSFIAQGLAVGSLGASGRRRPTPDLEEHLTARLKQAVGAEPQCALTHGPFREQSFLAPGAAVAQRETIATWRRPPSFCPYVRCATAPACRALVPAAAALVTGPGHSQPRL